jgi:glycosyltransferase involved in cell wall biosynthesis
MSSSKGLGAKVTCIVPFFNEGARVLHVLDALSRSRGVSQIVCVDDGSAEETYKKIRTDFLSVEVVRLEQNRGKSRAVAFGLAHARENDILLFDADLREIDIAQLDAAIAAFTSSPWVDMMILRRVKDLLLCRLMRIEIVLSGERLLRRCDLSGALESNPLGYQLELAINDYMESNDKRVSWMPLASQHTVKIAKSGLPRGIVKEIKQHTALMRFKGAGWYLWNLATFCLWEYGYEGNLVRALRRLAA